MLNFTLCFIFMILAQLISVSVALQLYRRGEVK